MAKQRFMAVYIGTPPRPGDDRVIPDQATIGRGMAAWQAWMEKHADIITDTGGPLGKTKRIGPDGRFDTSNTLTGYVIFEAEDHEAAAALFDDHPHFSIFPGDSVEVMPVMPMPGG